MEKEAKDEIDKKQPLFGLKLIAHARRENQEEALFEIQGQEILAVVHLTWSGKTEWDGLPTIKCLIHSNS